MVLRSAVRMDNLRGGDWGEIQNNAHRVRSMHSRSSLFSVVFMCLISPTQKIKLEKSTLNTKEWDKSKFDETLELWIFILDYFVAPPVLFNSRELGFNFFLLLLFAGGTNRRHLGCGNVTRSRLCTVKNKGITLSTFAKWNINSNHNNIKLATMDN